MIITATRQRRALVGHLPAERLLRGRAASTDDVDGLYRRRQHQHLRRTLELGLEAPGDVVVRQVHGDARELERPAGRIHEDRLHKLRAGVRGRLREYAIHVGDEDRGLGVAQLAELDHPEVSAHDGRGLLRVEDGIAVHHGHHALRQHMCHGLARCRRQGAGCQLLARSAYVGARRHRDSGHALLDQRRDHMVVQRRDRETRLREALA
mmetsp:Transcript_46615/g.120713  ORF Transcript_46615/g.120713 Transcript_46615/m.120713 type:complete len:208 (+) Transcript_46615:69-692(+)